MTSPDATTNPGYMRLEKRLISLCRNLKVFFSQFDVLFNGNTEEEGIPPWNKANFQ